MSNTKAIIFIFIHLFCLVFIYLILINLLKIFILFNHDLKIKSNASFYIERLNYLSVYFYFLCIIIYYLFQNVSFIFILLIFNNLIISNKYINIDNLTFKISIIKLIITQSIILSLVKYFIIFT
jgi:hypothetical protein